MTGRRVRKWIYWAEHGAGMLPHCHGGLGDTNPGEKTLGQEKICHNCLPCPLVAQAAPALSSPCQKVSMRVTEANIWLHRPPLAWRHLPKQDKQIWWS